MYTSDKFTQLTSSDISTSIDDIIKCYICKSKIIDPVMCPYCQKLSCQKCIQKWLREKKNQCPRCHRPLNPSDIIKVSFMNDVASYLEKLSTKKQVEKIEICPKHSIQFLYYCSFCKIPLCSDCYMFENDHKSHDIKKISVIYKEHLNKIKEEKTNVENKYTLLSNNLMELNDKISEITAYKRKKTKELNEAFKYFNDKLDKRIDSLAVKLSDFREEIKNKLSYLDDSRKKIDKEIGESSQSELINKSENIISNIKKINNENKLCDSSLFSPININLNDDIPNDILPNYDKFDFVVDNYKETLINCIRNNTENINIDNIIYSPEMKINGITWRVKLYPFGNNSVRGEYLSVFLECTDGLNNEKSVYFYKMELINYINTKKNLIQEYSSEFANAESWGYSKFYKLDKLENEGFIEKDTGNIKIVVYIRPKNYLLLVRDLKNYISVLESKVDKNYNEYEGENIEDKKSNVSGECSLSNDIDGVESFISEEDIKKIKEGSGNKSMNINNGVELDIAKRFFGDNVKKLQNEYGDKNDDEADNKEVMSRKYTLKSSKMKMIVNSIKKNLEKEEKNKTGGNKEINIEGKSKSKSKSHSKSKSKGDNVNCNTDNNEVDKNQIKNSCSNIKENSNLVQANKNNLKETYTLLKNKIKSDIEKKEKIKSDLNNINLNPLESPLDSDLELGKNIEEPKDLKDGNNSIIPNKKENNSQNISDDSYDYIMDLIDDKKYKSNNPKNINPNQPSNINNINSINNTINALSNKNINLNFGVISNNNTNYKNRNSKFLDYKSKINSNYNYFNEFLTENINANKNIVNTSGSNNNIGDVYPIHNYKYFPTSSSTINNFNSNNNLNNPFRFNSGKNINNLPGSGFNNMQKNKELLNNLDNKSKKNIK